MYCSEMLKTEFNFVLYCNYLCIIVLIRNKIKCTNIVPKIIKIKQMETIQVQNLSINDLENIIDNCFKENFFWDFLLQKLSRNYARCLRDKPDYHNTHTAIFEFARGSEHGGWAQAYPQLSDDVLSKASTMHIYVTWEESLRKNRRRYNPDKPDSILEHALEDKKMEMLYKESDWEEFSSKDPYYLHARNHKVPYAVFNNMPEITDQPEKLGRHLKEVTDKLWKIKNNL